MKTRKPRKPAKPPARTPGTDPPATMSVSVRQVLQTPRPQQEPDRRRLQRSFVVSRSADPLELEADQAVAAVVAGHDLRDPPTQGVPPDAAAGPPASATLQPSRAVGGDAVGGGSVGVPSLVHETLRSAGQPLDERVRTYFERRLGWDFGQVRIHTDSRAAESAAAVEALAYTVGTHIAFGRGQYEPSSPGGRTLLAHELIHTMQQEGATASPSLRVSAHDGAVEREAHQVAVDETRRPRRLQRTVLQRQPTPQCVAAMRRPVRSDFATGRLAEAAIITQFEARYGPNQRHILPDASAGPMRTGGPSSVIPPQVFDITAGSLRGSGRPDLAVRSRTGRAMLLAEIKSANYSEFVAGEAQLLNYIDKGNSPDNEELRRRLGVMVFAPMLPRRFRLPRTVQVARRRFRVMWCGPGMILYQETRASRRRQQRRRRAEERRRQAEERRRVQREARQRRVDEGRGTARASKRRPAPARAGAFNFGFGISIMSSGVGAGNVGVGISIMSEGVTVGTVSAGVVYDSQGAAVGTVGAGVSVRSEAAAAGVAGAGLSRETSAAGAGIAAAGSVEESQVTAAGAAGAGRARGVVGTAGTEDAEGERAADDTTDSAGSARQREAEAAPAEVGVRPRPGAAVTAAPEAASEEGAGTTAESRDEQRGAEGASQPGGTGHGLAVAGIAPEALNVAVAHAARLDALLQQASPAQRSLMQRLVQTSPNGLYTVPAFEWLQLLMTATEGISDEDLAYLETLDWQPANVTGEQLRERVRRALSRRRVGQPPEQGDVAGPATPARSREGPPPERQREATAGSGAGLPDSEPREQEVTQEERAELIRRLRRRAQGWEWSQHRTRSWVLTYDVQHEDVFDKSFSARFYVDDLTPQYEMRRVTADVQVRRTRQDRLVFLEIERSSVIVASDVAHGTLDGSAFVGLRLEAGP
jgi:hypothetical protein